MKVRIGFGFGVRTRVIEHSYPQVVDALEDLGYDSLWLSERIGGDARFIDVSVFGERSGLTR